MNLPLKIALISEGQPIYQTGKEVDIDHTRLSKIIHGLVRPREDEKRRLSEKLGKPVHELFPPEYEDGISEVLKP